MAFKPEIQYVGQFYVYGSEAKQVAVENPRKQAKTMLPLFSPDRMHRIHVDPVAICGLVMAMVLFAVMVMGAMQIQTAWQDFRMAKNYLETVQTENRALENKYHAEYDLEAVETIALGMGMVPSSEVTHMTITVTVPQAEAEPTWWDDTVWFLNGLFDKA